MIKSLVLYIREKGYSVKIYRNSFMVRCIISIYANGLLYENSLAYMREDLKLIASDEQAKHYMYYQIDDKIEELNRAVIRAMR